MGRLIDFDSLARVQIIQLLIKYIEPCKEEGWDIDR